MTAGVEAFVRGSGTRGGERRRWVGPVLAGVVLVAIALLALQPTETGVPFDPTSTEATGLRGLVDTLEALEVPVVVSDDPTALGAVDSVLVPPLGWPRQLVDQLAADGARVVAAVPPTDEAVRNPLGVGGIGLVDLTPTCALLDGVTSLRTSQWDGWQADAGTEVSERCLTVDAAAWLHRVPLGEGELVSLATMAPLTNERLLDSDAALAGVRLLAPTGTERVAVLLAPPGEPPPTLADLVDRRWFDAAWLTLGVLVLLALAQGRRLGRPVTESLPVRVPSGELARAIGDLRHRAGHHGRAVAVLRTRTLTGCRRRLGLPPSTPPEAVVDELRAHGVAVGPQLEAALTGPLADDGQGLVAAARALAELRQRLHGTTTPPSSPSPPDDRTPS